MIEPKPLSFEARDAINAMLARYTTKLNLTQMLEDAMAAEAYWREAVKNAGFEVSYLCPFCRCGYGEGHKLGCAFVLAQDGE